MKLKIFLSIKKEWRPIKNNKAFSLVEVVLATSLFILLVATLSANLIYSRESVSFAGDRSRAAYLAEEALEATRNIRDADFANLVDGTYGLATSSGEWLLSGTFDLNGIYTRQITISTINANTKQVNAQVNWQQTPERIGTISLSTYLTKWADAVPLGIGDWSNPSQGSAYNIANNQAGYRIDSEGDYAYVIKITGSPNFSVIDISNTSTPSQVGSLTLSGSPRNIAVSGNYAYVTGRDDNQELQIIDISNPSTPSQIASFNASGNTDGMGIDVSGTMVAISRTDGAALNDEFILVDVSTPSSPVLFDSLDLNNAASEVAISGNYAYVSSYDDNSELQIIDISNPTNIALAGVYNFTGNTNGVAISAFSSTVIIGRADGMIYIMDTSVPSAPVILGSYDALTIANDLSLGNSNNYVFIASDENSAEFQVIDISNPSLPSLVGSVNLANDLNGVAYNYNHDVACVASDNTAQEFIIIYPQ